MDGSAIVPIQFLVDPEENSLDTDNFSFSISRQSRLNLEHLVAT